MKQVWLIRTAGEKLKTNMTFNDFASKVANVGPSVMEDAFPLSGSLSAASMGQPQPLGSATTSFFSKDTLVDLVSDGTKGVSSSLTKTSDLSEYPFGFQRGWLKK